MFMLAEKNVAMHVEWVAVLLFKKKLKMNYRSGKNH